MNQAHYVLEIADYLIDSDIKLKSGLIYSENKE